ncbi:MAG: hypothetical protein KGI38_05160 [Thaumarchaeota archaeon]|nr:hypothetical protein [Nitrososphaerota archaeon]
MKKLPADLRKRAENLLRAYNGLEGFSKNPPWLIDIVLKTWFTEAERRKLLDFLLQGVNRETGLRMSKEIGMD